MLVLCVDGDPDALHGTAERLEETLPNASVISVESAPTGLSVLDSKSVDCVVSGYDLPGEDGIEFLRKVRDRDPDLPFVLLSVKDSVINEALSAGASVCVRKDGSDPLETLCSYLRRVAEDRTPDRTNNAESGRIDRAVLDAIDDAVFVYDPNADDVEDIKRQLCDFWGYPYGEHSDGDEYCTAVDPVSHSNVRESLRAALEEGELRTQWRCETNRNERFWVDVRLRRATVDGSERVVVLAWDHTDSRRRTVDLETFGAIAKHADHAIHITDLDGTIEYVNPAFEEMTGYSAREAVGEDSSILQSGEHDEAFYRDLWESILDGEVWSGEVVNRRKDGETYVIAQTIVPIADEFGDVTRFVAISDEITGRDRFERRLHSLNEAARTWLNATSERELGTLVVGYLRNVLGFDLVAMYVWDDAEGALVPDAAAVESETGSATVNLPRFDESDAQVWRVFEDGAGRIYDDFGSIRKLERSIGDAPIDRTLLCPLGDHGLLVVGQSDSGFQATERAITGIVASTVAEVMDRIDRERELKTQRDQLEEFAGIVTHDLRNPLTVAKGNVELARELGEDTAFDRIEEAHDRMDRIIDDLLVLSRRDQGGYARRTVELSRIVETAWSSVDTADATLRMECDFRLEADENRLLRLFENLFQNAVEHAGPDVTVRIGSIEDDGFYVEDTGPGLSKEEREQIFKPGYSSSHGTGFGLSIVRTVVDAHGWALKATDGTDGGLRFEIRDVDSIDESNLDIDPDSAVQ